jgi:hypothetical protein
MATANVVYSARAQDAEGVEGPVTFYVEADDTQTLAQAVTGWGAWVAQIDAVSDCQIVGGKISITPVLPGGIKGSPGANKWEQGAVFNWQQTGSTKKAGFFVPGLKAAAISAGKVLLTQTDVAALLTAILGATLGGSYASPTFNILTGFRDVFLSYRKRRKQLRAFSYEI